MSSDCKIFLCGAQSWCICIRQPGCIKTLTSNITLNRCFENNRDPWAARLYMFEDSMKKSNASNQSCSTVFNTKDCGRFVQLSSFTIYCWWWCMVRVQWCVQQTCAIVQRWSVVFETTKENEPLWSTAEKLQHSAANWIVCPLHPCILVSQDSDGNMKRVYCALVHTVDQITALHGTIGDVFSS